MANLHYRTCKKCRKHFTTNIRFGKKCESCKKKSRVIANKKRMAKVHWKYQVQDWRKLVTQKEES